MSEAVSEDETRVRVTFIFTPEEPDAEDDTGMSEDEYVRLVSSLVEVGAEDIEMAREL